LNAFVQVDPERVRRQAREAEAAGMSGQILGPLHGVPISIKSSIDVAGMKCEAGTRLRAGFVATQDAPLVERLRQAGAIILGVTNTPELLMAWETDNLLYGRTNSPWDLDRTPGGSSGGEAAAIASRPLQRHLRSQANSRTHPFDWSLSALRRSICFARCGGPDGAHRSRSQNSV
jgi:Asp-tRNA(Asn)/Glu-tRNA(Gln) amidotransferase A subunit family amidase